MAQLCTLEGEYKGLSIDDLFDVNDFLGVKIFGVDNWNKIKSYACQIAQNAVNSPTFFYIESLKNDYPNYKASPISNRLFGFRDAEGVALLGSLPWERLKVTMDAELLGGFWDYVKKGIGYIDTFSNLPGTAAKSAITYASEETPLKEIPTYNFFYEKIYQPGNKLISYVRPDSLVTEAKIITGVTDISPIEEKAAEIRREQSEVYQQYISDEQARKAAEAAAKASYAATAEQAEQLKYAKQLKEYNDAIEAEQKKIDNVLFDIDFQQQVADNKFIGYVAAGSAALLAIYWFKNRKKNK